MCHTFLFMFSLFVYIEVTYAKSTHNIRWCHLFRAVFRVELTSLSKSCDQIWQQFEMTQADEIVSITTLKEVLNMVHEFSEIKCQKMNEPLCLFCEKDVQYINKNGKIKSNTIHIILKRLIEPIETNSTLSSTFYAVGHVFSFA